MQRQKNIQPTILPVDTDDLCYECNNEIVETNDNVTIPDTNSNDESKENDENV